ncbi:MAG: hypothetical protein LBR73_08535 [Oscillospiraceae bacterium]|nr:hypothetical protein [Oscillospiraceae bacterium]
MLHGNRPTGLLLSALRRSASGVPPGESATLLLPKPIPLRSTGTLLLPLLYCKRYTYSILHRPGA